VNKLLGSSLNPKWHLEEIQSCENLLQVKRLVLGSVKRTINVIVAKNEEVIATERRCKITLEDF
jgi:hypothetical protein